MSPQEEQQAQSRFTWRLALLVIIVLGVVAFVARGQYAHPQPEADCSRPYDYPMCQRAAAPQPLTPPGITQLYLGAVTMAALCAVLVWMGWQASVTHQAEIVTSMAGSAPAQPSAQPAPQPVPQEKRAEAAHGAPPASVGVAPSASAPVKAAAKGASEPKGSVKLPEIKLKGAKQQTVRKSSESRPLGRVPPPTIVNNDITPDMVVKAPKAVPRAGIDPKLLEVKKDA